MSKDPAASWNTPPGFERASQVLWCDGATGEATLADADGPRRTWGDPLAALDWMAESIRESARQGRWIGYLSYDLGRHFETMPLIARDDLGLPLFVFTHHSDIPASGESYLSTVRSARGGELQSNFTLAQFLERVRRILEYIRAGDVFQVNFAQRFTTPQTLRTQEIFERLPPAAFGATLNYGSFALLSHSPELFLRVTPDGHIVTRPIKGTRPVAAGMELALRESLKDQAELNMIVDLERNDLGRVCQVGSVRVAEPRVIEDHGSVYHGVATIEGRLSPHTSFVDLLRAVFPGGSVTGAPKIRAMQIIDELEMLRRGPYCGAIGYLDSEGNIEFNVAIRTMILCGGNAHVWVGGGIVADSDPDQEYEETLVKAQAMFAALGARYNQAL